jgi:hypothetical protein
MLGGKASLRSAATTDRNVSPFLGARRKASAILIVFNDQLDPAVAKAIVAIEKHPFGWHPAIP